MNQPLDAERPVPDRDIVVTRYPGAAQWVQQQLQRPVETIEHLPPRAIEAGVRYFGVFPLGLAAAICTAGSECWGITVQVPPQLRGLELTPQQLDALGAVLTLYRVSALATYRNP